MSDTSENTKVLFGPSLVDGGASRIVDSGDRAWTETWDGSSWVKGGAGMREVVRAPPLSPAGLAKRGIPVEGE